jgi:hypothetical protein
MDRPGGDLDAHEARMNEPAGRWVGVAGALVPVLLVLSSVLVTGGGGAPEADRSDATILEWYSDSGNQVRYVLGAVVAALAVLALLVFLVGLRVALESAHAPRAATELAYAGGLVLASLAFVEIAVGSSIAAIHIFSDTFELDPDTARIVLTIGNIWLPAVSGAPGGLFVGAAALAARRARLLPGWVTWAGLVLAPLSVVPAFGANSYLPVLWVLLASIPLLRRCARPALETRPAGSHNP